MSNGVVEEWQHAVEERIGHKPRPVLLWVHGSYLLSYAPEMYQTYTVSRQDNWERYWDLAGLVTKCAFAVAYDSVGCAVDWWISPDLTLDGEDTVRWLISKGHLVLINLSSDDKSDTVDAIVVSVPQD